MTLRYATSPSPLDAVTTEAPGTFHLSVKDSGVYTVAADAPGFVEAVFDGGSGIQVSESEFEPGRSPSRAPSPSDYPGPAV